MLLGICWFRLLVEELLFDNLLVNTAFVDLFVCTFIKDVLDHVSALALWIWKDFDLLVLLICGSLQLFGYIDISHLLIQFFGGRHIANFLLLEEVDELVKCLRDLVADLLKGGLDGMEGFVLGHEKLLVLHKKLVFDAQGGDHLLR